MFFEDDYIDFKTQIISIIIINELINFAWFSLLTVENIYNIFSENLKSLWKIKVEIYIIFNNKPFLLNTLLSTSAKI